MRDPAATGSLLVPLSAVLFVLATAIVVSRATTAADETSTPDCFYSDDSEDSPAFHWINHRECNTDLLRVSELPEVRETETMLRVHPDQIVFIGCAAAPFAIQSASTVPPYRVRIFYPARPEIPVHEHVAPIIHEVGHAYQLIRAGSRERLLASLSDSIERVELGADFLAGLAAKQLNMNPGQFQTNDYLVGTYNNTSSNYHGDPENRVSAFRYGYKAPAGQIDSQYSDFQDNEFGRIKNAERQRRSQ